jgi:hypothetical protein
MLTVGVILSVGFFAQTKIDFYVILIVASFRTTVLPRIQLSEYYSNSSAKSH